MSDKFFTDYFKFMQSGMESVSHEDLIKAAEKIKTVSKAGNKLIIAGNGGSAAMASHVAVDFTKAAGIRAVNFNEADLLTCFANDYGYDRVFEKAVELYGDEGDLLILISSSGSSANVVNVAKRAKEFNMGIITFSGFKSDNLLCQLGDINFWVDSHAYNIVEMTHHIWLLAIIDYIIGDIEYPAS
jgi:D-sedoheptulose 7-phosphate isomerase|tara:strand:+ start:784 stop:1341 length:558 start_codon:yes stop_codon:yes gene_type:complete